MAKKRVKAKDVAEWAGVSQTTVSMVLNNYSNASISEETRQRVFKACEELGYVVRKAGFRSDEQSRIILMVCPSFDNQHYVKVLNSAQQRAIELGFEPVVFCTQRKEAEEAWLVGLCRQLNVSGVLMAYSPYNSSAYRLLSMEVPHVLIYDKTFNTNTNIIALDNYKIGQIIGEHLIGLGHKHIAHISRQLHRTQTARYRRIEGIRSAMQEAGIDPDKYLRVCTLESEGLDNTLRVEGRTGLPLALGAAVGGIAGNACFKSVSRALGSADIAGAAQAAVLLLLVLGTALYTVNKKKIRPRCVQSAPVCALIGFALGALSSFLGIGGGPFNLVVLHFVLGQETKQAVENSLFIILLSQIANILLSVFTHSVPAFELPVLLVMIAGGIGGGAAGKRLGKKLSADSTDKLFIGLLAVISAICVYNIFKHI